jgi:hypothetical protein
MNRRILHCGEGTKIQPQAALGRYADGVVAEAEDERALALLAEGAHVSLLWFSRAEYDYALRKLDETGREAAIRKRLADWAPEAVSQGMDRLYRVECRCLTLAAMSGNTGVFEHTMDSLERLTNEGAYGNLKLAEILVVVLQKEALLAIELSNERLTPERSERYAFSVAIARELRRLGRPQFSEHLPYAEPARAAFVSPRDPQLMKELKALRLPVVEWRDGLVSTFGPRTLNGPDLQKKQVNILYADARHFRRDLANVTRPELEREFEERSSEGPMPRWTEYLNILRLEIALLRRAAHDKAAVEKDISAAVLRTQVSRESALLAAELARHPSWLEGELGPRPANLAAAEQEVLRDALFLEHFAQLRGPEDLHRRYRAFAKFKAGQVQQNP